MISFALPLPVGQASDCEILDFEVTEEREGAGLTEALNGTVALPSFYYACPASAALGTAVRRGHGLIGQFPLLP